MSRSFLSHRIGVDQGITEQAGFTLVELMVVVAIVLLLLLIAVPSFADLIDRARVRGAAGAAITVLSEARGAAVQRNRDVVVKFGGTDPAWCLGAVGVPSPAAGTQYISGTGAACACDSAPTLCTVNGTSSQQLTVLSSDYNGVTLGARPANFRFDGRLGDVQNFTTAGWTAPSVTFTSPKGTYQIQLTVAALGQASMCTPTTAPAIPGISSC